MRRHTLSKFLAGLCSAVLFAGAVPFDSITEFAADAASQLYGDVNDDGVIDELDVTALSEAIESGTDAASMPAADVDGDNSLTSSDVEWISSYISGESTYFPMGTTCPSPYTYMTRGEWIHTLVTAFEMSFEDETGMVEYYSDLDDCTYKKDIDIAANYGVFDVISDEFDPDIYVTREFAAHTMNYCLGFENDAAAVFMDEDSVYYAGDAQVSLNRGWFVMNSGEFQPELYATEDELQTAITDMNTVLAESASSEDIETVLSYSDSVIEITDAQSASLSGNVITVIGSKTAVSPGDFFSVPLSEDVTVVRKAEDVVTDEETGDMTITFSDIDEEVDGEVVEEVQAEGYAYVDYDNIKQIDDEIEIEVTTPEEEAEAPAAEETPIVQSAEGGMILPNNFSIQTQKDGTLKPGGKVKASLNKTINGLKVTGSATLSNIRIPYKLNYSLLSLKKLSIGFDADLDLKVSVSGTAKNAVSIPYATVPLAGCGILNATMELSLNVSVSGEISLSYSLGIDSAVEYTKGSGFRFVKNFQTKSVTLAAEVNLKLALRLGLNISVGTKKIGSIYAQAGINASIKVSARNTKLICTQVESYLFAEAGVEISFLGCSWSKSYPLWDKSNSPYKGIMHWENGSKVAKCTYDPSDPVNTATTPAKVAQAISADKISGSYTKKKGSTGYNTGTHSATYQPYNSYTIAFEEMTPPAEINEATTLTKDVTYNYGLIINADLDLNGHTLTVKGDVTVNDATITLSKGTMDVSGDFNMKDWWPSVKFEYKEDTLVIGGDYDDRNATQPTFLSGTAGTLEFKGDVYCKGLSFSNLHKTIFSGTEDQNIYLADGWDNFNVVEIKNSDSKKICVENRFSVDGATVIDGTTLHLENTKNISGDNAQIKLSNCSAENLIIDGDVSLDTLEFTGKTITTNGNISTTNDINLNGCTWNCNGNLTVGDSININGGILNVDGDVNNRTNNFKMENKKDVVNITGDFINNMWCYSFTNGVLKIGGSIIANEDIEASENHRTILTGEEDCDLYMAESYSYLNYLEIENAGSRKFTVDGYFRANSTNCGEESLNIIANDIPGNTGSISFGELTCTELNVEGNVNFYENNDFKGSSININGNPSISGTFNLNKAEINIKENVTQTGGTVDLSAGKLTVPGSFTQTGGTLDVNGAALDIAGDISLNGKLKMNNGAGKMTVGGDWDSNFNSAPDITAGVIELAGDFNDVGTNYCMRSSGTAQFFLTGEKDQTVKIDYYPTGSTNYHFANLTVNNADTRNIILKGFLDAKEIFCDGKLINITSSGGLFYNLKLRTPLNITGDLIICGDVIDLNGYQVTVNGNLYQHSGKILVNTGKLDVTGDYLLVQDQDSAVYSVSYGILSMTNDGDYVSVGGDFITKTNQNHKNYLTAGVLEIKGDFHQMADGTTYAFPASGTHIAYLSGDGAQTVTFDSYSDSHFNKLVLAKDESNYTFNENPCWTELGEQEAVTTPAVKVTAEPVTTVTTASETNLTTDDPDVTTKATTEADDPDATTKATTEATTDTDEPDVTTKVTTKTTTDTDEPDVTTTQAATEPDITTVSGTDEPDVSESETSASEITYISISYVTTEVSGTVVTQIVIVDCEEDAFVVVIPAEIDGITVSRIEDNVLSSSGIFYVTFENPDIEIPDSPTAINPFALIMGYSGSTAEAYAEKYERDFVSLDGYIIGDANEDGVVNVRDAAFIAQKLAKGLADELPSFADFNEDGNINVRDAAAIAKFLATGK
ncbi:MAG: dockerin type I domain-containing protein [Porcipelethomonas sp.]